MSTHLIHPIAESPERPHAERSASQLKSLALCPGYTPAKKDPTKEVHWVTQQGIRGHAALEHGDNSELQSNYELSLVQLCEDYVDALPEAYSDQREPKIITIEGRWGYADRLRFRKESPAGLEVDIIDYKFVKVKSPEDAEINLQGIDYTVGVFEANADIAVVNIHFLAPRFGMVTTARFTRGQLPELKLRLFAVLTQARRTDAKRVPAKLLRAHYETCRFCGRAPTCPAIKSIAKKIYDSYVNDAHAEPLPEVPANVHASQSTESFELGSIKVLASAMDAWSKAASHHCLTKAVDEGIIASGYTVGFRKGRRSITQPLALLSIGPKFGLDLSDVLSAATISAAQLEDAVMAKAATGQKKHVKTAFVEALRDADVLEDGEEVPVLVKISTEKIT